MAAGVAEVRAATGALAVVDLAGLPAGGVGEEA